MAGRIENVETHAFYLYLVPIFHPHGHDVSFGVLAHDGYAMCPIAQFGETGDVIGVKVGINVTSLKSSSRNR